MWPGTHDDATSRLASLNPFPEGLFSRDSPDGMTPRLLEPAGAPMVKLVSPGGTAPKLESPTSVPDMADIPERPDQPDTALKRFGTAGYTTSPFSLPWPTDALLLEIELWGVWCLEGETRGWGFPHGEALGRGIPDVDPWFSCVVISSIEAPAMPASMSGRLSTVCSSFSFMLRLRRRCDMRIRAPCKDNRSEFIDFFNDFPVFRKLKYKYLHY